MTKQLRQHEWLLHVLENLIEHAVSHDMPTIATALRQAEKAMLLRELPLAQGATLERQWFVDTVRDLMDYAEAHEFEEAQAHFAAALETAPREWERAENVAVRVPLRTNGGN